MKESLNKKVNWSQESELSSIKKSRKTGDEEFNLNGKKLGFLLRDFWQWSASDLVSNTLRGILAEFIVAKSLNLADTIRAGWSAYDLLLPNGVKIEVKSASYIQSWYQKGLSKISFGIGKTKEWSEQTNILASESKRQADIYVFCLLKHKDKETINPLNLEQWEFYILPTSELEAKFKEQKQISLEALKKLVPIPIKYEEIPLRINELVKSIQGNLKATQ